MASWISKPRMVTVVKNGRKVQEQATKVTKTGIFYLTDWWTDPKTHGLCIIRRKYDEVLQHATQANWKAGFEPVAMGNGRFVTISSNLILRYVRPNDPKALEQKTEELIVQMDKTLKDAGIDANARKRDEIIFEHLVGMETSQLANLIATGGADIYLADIAKSPKVDHHVKEICFDRATALADEIERPKEVKKTLERQKQEEEAEARRPKAVSTRVTPENVEDKTEAESKKVAVQERNTRGGDPDPGPGPGDAGNPPPNGGGGE